MVLARFGPRLPALIENVLMRSSNEPPLGPHKPFWRWMVLAGVIGMAAGGVIVMVLDSLT